MCDPLTLAGLALTAGSTVANTVAQNRVASARNDALAAERIRQGGLDREAEALNAQSQDRYQNFEGQQEQKAAKLSDYFKSQDVPEPSAEAALPVSASNLTVQEENKQRGKAQDFTNRTGEALGNLRSFGDLMGGLGRMQARDAAQIGQIGGFKQGSSAVLPYELEAANEKGAGLRLFGDVMGGLGGVSTMAGLSGAMPFGLGGDALSRNLVKAGVPGVRAVGPVGGLRNLFGGV